MLSFITLCTIVLSFVRARILSTTGACSNENSDGSDVATNDEIINNLEAMRTENARVQHIESFGVQSNDGQYLAGRRQVSFRSSRRMQFTLKIEWHNGSAAAGGVVGHGRWCRSKGDLCILDWMDLVGRMTVIGVLGRKAEC